MVNSPPSRPRIGVSSCLLGGPLRYDGGHLRNEFLTQTLAPHVEWTSVCPESEVGMGTPREPVRLVDTGGGALRMRGVRSGTDHTDVMRSWAACRVEELAGLGAARLRTHEEFPQLRPLPREGLPLRRRPRRPQRTRPLR